MKYQTTRKAVVNGSRKLISAGYCDLCNLLHNHSPNAYTCGVYGWNFDVYDVYGLTICTGYRNMPGRTANNSSEYDRKARAIMTDCERPYEERCEAVEELLREFCEQA